MALAGLSRLVMAAWNEADGWSLILKCSHVVPRWGRLFGPRAFPWREENCYSSIFGIFAASPTSVCPMGHPPMGFFPPERCPSFRHGTQGMTDAARHDTYSSSVKQCSLTHSAKIERRRLQEFPSGNMKIVASMLEPSSCHSIELPLPSWHPGPIPAGSWGG